MGARQAVLTFQLLQKVCSGVSEIVDSDPYLAWECKRRGKPKGRKSKGVKNIEVEITLHIFCCVKSKTCQQNHQTNRKKEKKDEPVHCITVCLRGYQAPCIYEVVSTLDLETSSPQVACDFLPAPLIHQQEGTDGTHHPENWKKGKKNNLIAPLLSKIKSAVGSRIHSWETKAS